MTLCPHNPLQHQRQHDGIYHIGYFVGGKWSQAQEQFDVYNPATGELVARVAKSGKQETEAAIKAASEAFPAWRKRPLNSEQRFYSVGIC
ncbi:hypothetical protein A8M58_07695 [Yersinia pestis]|nr:hypothetical protein A8M58_07695 [Yersinia pestis]